MTKLEVVGAGYGRTGTMSLKKALEILEFGPCYHMEEIWGKPDMAEKLTRWADICQSSDGKAAIELITSEGYRSSVDFPSSALSMDMYRIVINIFWDHTMALPGKPKLEGYSWSQRKWDCVVQLRHHEKWYLSHMSTKDQHHPVNFYSEFGEAEWTQSYDEWVAHVKSTVKPENLLVFSSKDGWEPLCKFLGKEIPNVPFPRSNNKDAFHETFNVERIDSSK